MRKGQRMTEEQRQRLRAAASTPEARKERSERIKRCWATEKYRKAQHDKTFGLRRSERTKALLRKIGLDPEERRRRSERAKAMWQTEEFASKHRGAKRPASFSRFAKRLAHKLWSQSEFSEMQSRKAARQWRNPEFRKALLGRKETGIERKVREWLEQNGIPFEQEAAIEGFNGSLDFLVDILDIECDGTYWHSSQRSKMHDRQRDLKVGSLGYKIIRLGEADINNHWCRVESRLRRSLSAMRKEER